jgi:CheY-like chemotaxis protein
MYVYIIVGVTGNALPSDIEDFINHGVTAVIPKPLKLAELRSAIKEHVLDAPSP